MRVRQSDQRSRINGNKSCWFGGEIVRLNNCVCWRATVAIDRGRPDEILLFQHCTSGTLRERFPDGGSLRPRWIAFLMGERSIC